MRETIRHTCILKSWAHRWVCGRSALASAQVVDDSGQIGSPEKNEALVQDLLQPGHGVLGDGGGVENDGEGVIRG